MAINAKRNVAPIRPGKSVMETIAQLDKDFPRIQEVGAAESETVVEQDAVVGDVDGLQVGGEFFAETFAERKVKSGVRLEMIVGDIRIAEIELGAIAEARRAEGKLPAIDSSGLYVNREEDTGVIQAVVIEKVGGASQKIIGIQDPTSKGNGHAELVLFIAFAGQPCEIQLLLVLDSVQSGPRKRAEWRRLIKTSVKAAEHPV